MAVASYQGGRWSPSEIKPVAPIELSPAAHVLHYASTCFEGFKAFRRADGTILTQDCPRGLRAVAGQECRHDRQSQIQVFHNVYVWITVHQSSRPIRPVWSSPGFTKESWFCFHAMRFPKRWRIRNDPPTQNNASSAVRKMRDCLSFE